MRCLCKHTNTVNLSQFGTGAMNYGTAARAYDMDHPGTNLQGKTFGVRRKSSSTTESVQYITSGDVFENSQKLDDYLKTLESDSMMALGDMTADDKRHGRVHKSAEQRLPLFMSQSKLGWFRVTPVTDKREQLALLKLIRGKPGQSSTMLATVDPNPPYGKEAAWEDEITKHMVKALKIIQ